MAFFAQVSKRRVESERLLTTFVAQQRGLFLFWRCSAWAVRIWGASVYETRRVNDRIWILVLLLYPLLYSKRYTPTATIPIFIVNSDTPDHACIMRPLLDVTKVTNVIFSIESGELGILMETGQTIQMRTMRQEVFDHINKDTFKEDNQIITCLF